MVRVHKADAKYVKNTWQRLKVNIYMTFLLSDNESISTTIKLMFFIKRKKNLFKLIIVIHLLSLLMKSYFSFR
jgi:hypothetical protein